MYINVYIYIHGTMYLYIYINIHVQKTDATLKARTVNCLKAVMSLTISAMVQTMPSHLIIIHMY